MFMVKINYYIEMYSKFSFFTTSAFEEENRKRKNEILRYRYLFVLFFVFCFLSFFSSVLFSFP